MQAEKIVLAMNELLLEHRGYSCIAKLYEDGRWGFGNGPFIDDMDPESPFSFFCFADNEEEARLRFAESVDQMIQHQEYNKTLEQWKLNTDYRSIASVVNILPDVFEGRIKSGQFDRTLLDGVEGGTYVVPLYYVTKAWDTLLKGTLGLQSFRVGPEEDDDFSEETLREFMEEEEATRSRTEAVAQNDIMKGLWKKYFDIDIDSIAVDFAKFDMHMPPNVSQDDMYYYFDEPMEGVAEWVMGPVNFPDEDWCLHDMVSCLMEFTAYVIKIER